MHLAVKEDLAAQRALGRVGYLRMLLVAMHLWAKKKKWLMVLLLLLLFPSLKPM